MKFPKNKVFIALIALVLLNACSSSSSSDEQIYTLKIDYSFSNLKEGFDHLSKMIVYIDGVVADTSSKKYESELNSIEIPIARGIHNLRTINLAYYQGTWEEHTKANNYNIDCSYETTISIDSDKEMKLLFDLDRGTFLESLK